MPPRGGFSVQLCVDDPTRLGIDIDVKGSVKQSCSDISVFSSAGHDLHEVAVEGAASPHIGQAMAG
jgi:hypothetical protein